MYYFWNLLGEMAELVYRIGLENRQTGNCFVGSNPTLSTHKHRVIGAFFICLNIGFVKKSQFNVQMHTKMSL
jgi:hypothetical protein